MKSRSSWKDCFRRLAGPLAICAALGVAGCESNPLSGTKVYPVRGKVVLPDGKPLAMGRIVFVATSSTLTAPATIESDGTFVVKGSLGEGLPEGQYKVRLEVDESKLPQVKARPAARSAPLPFPEKYLDEELSGLSATVKPGENAPLEFTLNKQTAAAPGKQSGRPGRD
jgi:hypothetical protein